MNHREDRGEIKMRSDMISPKCFSFACFEMQQREVRPHRS